MIESYRSGYLKCMVDLVNACNDTSVLSLKSGKKVRRFIESLLSAFVSHPDFLDEWIDYGGNPQYMSYTIVLSPEGEVKIK